MEFQEDTASFLLNSYKMSKSWEAHWENPILYTTLQSQSGTLSSLATLRSNYTISEKNYILVFIPHQNIFGDCSQKRWQEFRPF